MASTQPQNLQVKLSLDEGLKNTWNFLTTEYQALDKSGIIRLAINNLAKEVKKQDTISGLNFSGLFSELNNSQTGMSEPEFGKWWNKNKRKK